MNLTPEEEWSLTLAGSERTRQIRLVYFEIKRCPDCTERLSCPPHEKKMAEL